MGPKVVLFGLVLRLKPNQNRFSGKPLDCPTNQANKNRFESQNQAVKP